MNVWNHLPKLMREELQNKCCQKAYLIVGVGHPQHHHACEPELMLSQQV